MAEKWPVWDPVLDPENPPEKSLWGSLFCGLSQEMRDINSILGAQNWGVLGGGQKVYVEKVYVLFLCLNDFQSCDGLKLSGPWSLRPPNRAAAPPWSLRFCDAIFVLLRARKGTGPRDLTLESASPSPQGSIWHRFDIGSTLFNIDVLI